jgi:hypothetical protein
VLQPCGDEIATVLIAWLAIEVRTPNGYLEPWTRELPSSSPQTSISPKHITDRF